MEPRCDMCVDDDHSAHGDRKPYICPLPGCQCRWKPGWLARFINSFGK